MIKQRCWQNNDVRVFLYTFPSSTVCLASTAPFASSFLFSVCTVIRKTIFVLSSLFLPQQAYLSLRLFCHTVFSATTSAFKCSVNELKWFRFVKWIIGNSMISQLYSSLTTVWVLLKWHILNIISLEAL